MPRAGRLDAPGVMQHIMIRGIERRNIFCRGIPDPHLPARPRPACADPQAEWGRAAPRDPDRPGPRGPGGGAAGAGTALRGGLPAVLLRLPPEEGRPPTRLGRSSAPISPGATRAEGVLDHEDLLQAEQSGDELPHPAHRFLLRSSPALGAEPRCISGARASPFALYPGDRTTPTTSCQAGRVPGGPRVGSDSA
jgi:hypothetical protein